MSTYISNIKITQNDIIKNWWKLNYFDTLTTKDDGEGDVDFYTYWYSICYVVGMLNAFRSSFGNIEDYEQILRRFLQSREIAFKNDSTLDTLVHIYSNYVLDLNKRGTKLTSLSKGDTLEVGKSDYVDTGVIVDDVEFNSGIGILSNTVDLVGTLSDPLVLGAYHNIKFDILLTDGSGVQYDVGGTGLGGLFLGTNTGIYLLKNEAANSLGIASYSFTYKCTNISHTFTTDVNVGILNTVKFVRFGTIVSLYINDVFIDSDTVTIGNTYTATKLFTSKLPAVANIEIEKRDIYNVISSVYSWSCCEGSGFTLNSNRKPTYVSVLSIDSEETWGYVWRRSSLFANTDYLGIDSEVKRLINYIDGEYLFELIATSEVGWVMDISSPISEEASCVNLNKAYQKGDITDLGKFPLSFDSIVKPTIASTYIVFSLPTPNSIWYGLNSELLTNPDWKTLNSSKPIGQIPFIPIPVATYDDDLDGYEISFIIQSTKNIKLKFGISTYDGDLDVLTNKTKRYDTDTNSELFLNETDFSLCKNQDLWVRGVYSLSHLTGIADILNIGFGNNLYNDSTGLVKFIVPIVSFMAASANVVTVKIKDIVVRPLSLNTSKGVVSNKNLIIGYLRNDSGKAILDVTKFIENKLIPYNCVTNIQYL